MLPIIAGIVTVTVGSYLLNETSSSNSSARKKYKSKVKQSKEEIKKKHKQAQKKANLDSLHSLKRAKIKIADSIYLELKNTRKNLHKLNLDIWKTKKLLNELFSQKRDSHIYKIKLTIQQDINTIVQTRKELFNTRNLFIQNVKNLEKKLKCANIEVKNISNEIKLIEKRG